MPARKKIRDYRYDDCCPKCGELIGHITLGPLFDGKRIDGEAIGQRDLRGEIECPHCDTSLIVQLVSYFAIRKREFDE